METTATLETEKISCFWHLSTFYRLVKTICEENLVSSDQLINIPFVIRGSHLMSVFDLLVINGTCLARDSLD